MLKRKKQITPQSNTDNSGATFWAANASGFTLIELMIVIVIFTVGILGTMSMQLAASRTNRNAREAALAMEFASDTMEQLMNLGYFDNVDNDGSGIIDDGRDMWEGGPSPLAELDPAGNPHSRVGNPDLPDDAYANLIFNLTWNVTNLDMDDDNDTGSGPGFTDAKLIEIRVTWDNGDKWVDLTSIRSELI